MKNLMKNMARITTIGLLTSVSLNAISGSISNNVENQPASKFFGGGGSHGFWYIFEASQPWDGYFTHSGSKSVFVRSATNSWNHAGAYMGRPSGEYGCQGSAYVRGDSGSFDLLDASSWTYAAPSVYHTSSWSNSFNIVRNQFTDYSRYRIPETTAIRYVVNSGRAALIDTFRLSCESIQ